ncbi:MAG: DUF6519 domain-containing protein [Bryobacteraceae bacterium]
MKGDFTRKTFDSRNHYSRVLMQQGRVTVDADPNEQTDILLHYLRTLATDIIGPYAAPAVGGGFQLSANADGKLMIGGGRYYVDGVLIENQDTCLYSAQPYYPAPADDVLVKEMADATGKTYWAYLDVWERHLTYLDDDSMREVALGGPDTCSRSQVVWQVKALPVADSTTGITPACTDPLSGLMPLGSGLAARVDPGYQSSDPCVLSPEAKYRGTENHLYRVEVHHGGNAAQATFKWSRENGSVAASWLGSEGQNLIVSTGRGFVAGCWVEITTEADDLLGQPGVLVQLTKVEGAALSVDPAAVLPSWSETLVDPKVRRWDQKQIGDILLSAGAVPVTESSPTDPAWIDLEDGIQIQFQAAGQYVIGDYWLIPARVATGDIEWPKQNGVSQFEPAEGIEHHYAPLGFVKWDGKNLRLKSCRCEFDPLSSCFSSIGSLAVGAELLRKRTDEVPATSLNAATGGATPVKRAARRKQ